MQPSVKTPVNTDGQAISALPMHNENPEGDTQEFTISRLLNLSNNRPIKNFARRGIFFPVAKTLSSKFINFYNHGCPVEAWNIDPQKVARNQFKVFSTGDAFSVLSPNVAIRGENINIHVGVSSGTYAKSVLLHEALQLCRAIHEHGAERITLALPEQFHPVLYPDDFNLLLIKLFKASGANKLYYYDKNYQGILDENHIDANITFKVSQHSKPEEYQVSKSELSSYLELPANQTSESTIDAKVLHFTRRSYLNAVWSKLNLSHSKLMERVCEGAPVSLEVPEKKQGHVLICCSANRPLAEEIAEHLRQNGEEIKLYCINGAGIGATIPDEAVIAGSVVTIVQSTRPNPDDFTVSAEYEKNGASPCFFEAAMIARQAHLRGALHINLINPYQFSARSDKAEDNPKGKTGAYVQHNGKLFEAAGVNNVVTAECHDNHTLSGTYTGKEIRGSAVPALTILATRVATEWLSNPGQGQLRLVTPDAGAAKRTNELTQHLQSILGDKLCSSRVLGEKQRDSHQDTSALINNMNAGELGINAQDRYLITDDETATGNTLCQAISNLKKQGANNISVIVVHNNMPLNWLQRQLCLSRFLYMGVSDLHFSNTQEMGSLATGYDDLIQTYAKKAGLSETQVKEQVSEWFKKNIAESFPDHSPQYLKGEFDRFTSQLEQLKNKVTVHSLADEFAKRVHIQPSKVSVFENTPGVSMGYSSDKRNPLFAYIPQALATDVTVNTLPQTLGSAISN
ncbi:phosphoribosyltransferase family protein [Legionella sp. 16cNR16C]|uniref:phosphoribosyltransferase family protein n=1 Tax=Legionella sp. 16cNR16C TaxID=2905656 RepID=UPI001E4FFAA5|nr:phosphoribosyltransferase family protein [Legionella sp. 16cNR16C]MCE3045948.1 hypothetical protein [Legionella sp. 16cNR16C]